MENKFDQKVSEKEMQRLSRFGLGVFTYIFNRDFSKLLLVKRCEEKRKKYGFEWGVVGGKMEPGENSTEGAIREAREEVGLNISPEQLRFLYFEEIPRKERAFTAVQFYYAATLDENTRMQVNEESERYEWFPLNSLPESMGDSSEKVAKAIDLARRLT
jgi:ADP-ribose pyrophosphatase YjhB (NUDIX family)